MRSQRMATPARLATIALLSACVTGLALPAAARAQDDEAGISQQLKQMNDQAADQYDSLDFAGAKKVLQNALRLCAEHGLDQSPVAARTHLRLGIVLLVGFKQRGPAVEQFRQVLAIRPHMRLPEKMTTPEVAEAFRAAASAPPSAEGQKAEAAADADAEAAPVAADQPPAGKLGHAPVRKAARGEAIPIKVTTGEGLAPEKVVLEYRPDGATDFLKSELREVSPGRWSGQIPPRATNGDQVAYFIEARDGAGAVTAARGSAGRPWAVALGDAGDASDETADVDTHDEEDDGPHWFLGLGIGSGGGWTSGSGEVNPKGMVSPARIAASRLGQVTPELGYFVREGFLISLQLRLQYVTGATSQTAPAGSSDCGPDHVCEPAKAAVAGFARATWLWGAENLHPYLAITAGGGRIRHVAALKNVTTCGDPAKPVPCVDTVAAGPVFVGGGGGLLYDISDKTSLMLGFNALAGFTTFTAQVDIDGGIALQF
jgi:hypothetical protein